MKRSVSSTRTTSSIEVEAVLVGDPEQGRIAILHKSVDSNAELGVVIVVGGLQYRVGSQRYFVELADKLATRGLPTIRYDHVGCGDAYGDAKHFSANTEELGEAITLILESCNNLSGVILWGLCDGATAAAEYAHLDPRVKGVVLVNGWIHSPWQESKNLWLEYYSKRIFDPNTWLAYIRNPSRIGETIRAFWSRIASLRNKDPLSDHGKNVVENLTKFTGNLMSIVSGSDVTGLTFIDYIKDNAPNVYARLDRVEIAGADHTFTQNSWRQACSDYTLKWIQEIQQNAKHSST